MWQLDFDSRGRLTAYWPWVPDDDEEDEDDEEEEYENGIFIEQGSGPRACDIDGAERADHAHSTTHRPAGR